MDKIKGLVKRENGYRKMTADEAKACAAYNADYLSYLGIAKTERRAYDEAVRRIEALGFVELSTKDTLKPGDKVYRGYHGKTLMAVVIGEEPVAKGINVIGGHTDAPRIDIKPVPICEKGGIAYFDTHYYGGIKKFHWLTHPLALYGVIVKPDGTKVEIAIGDKPEDPVFQITDILPHFGAEQSGKKLGEAFDPEDMDIVVGSIPVAEDEDDEDVKEKVKLNILRLLEKEYGVTEEDFLSAELELVPAGMPRELGLDRAMIVGYGHDDRVCAYAGLKALMDLPAIPRRTGMVLLCDKEEIGSVGATGMDSTFFENSVAELIARQNTPSPEVAVRRALEASRMLSADVCAASDPHFPTADSPNNMAMMHAGGCMIKYTGARGKGGASDARAEFIADLRRIFAADGLTWQAGELGRCEKGGGGTIALYMARYGMDVVDFGVPLFNMHAPWEAASKYDCYMTYRAYKAFLAD
ncbi:MAG: aminopeptidase [bacterium]|nr:aminopeptidase [bacterium]